jgi:hypothetical protein
MLWINDRKAWMEDGMPWIDEDADWFVSGKLLPNMQRFAAAAAPSGASFTRRAVGYHELLELPNARPRFGPDGDSFVGRLQRRTVARRDNDPLASSTSLVKPRLKERAACGLVGLIAIVH